MNYHNGAPAFSPDDFHQEPTFDQSGPFPPLLSLETENTQQKPIKFWRKVLRHTMGKKHRHGGHHHPHHHNSFVDSTKAHIHTENPKADFQESLPSTDVDIPLEFSLGKSQQENLEKQSWRSRVHEKLNSVAEKFGLLKRLWVAGDKDRQHIEVQDTDPTTLLGTDLDTIDPFEGDEDGSPKVELTREQRRELILAKAAHLGQVLKQDRGDIPGATTTHKEGFYYTEFPERTKTTEGISRDNEMPTEGDDMDPFKDDESLDAVKDRGLVQQFSLETKEKAKNAREKIKKMIPNMLEKYDKLPLAGKLAISGALIGAGVVATATGSTALAAGVWGGAVAMRGVGSYFAGRTVEKIMRARALKNAQGEQLTALDEKKLWWTKASTAVLVFAAGTWAEYALHGLPSFMNSGAEGHVVTAVPTHAPVSVATTQLPAASDIIQQIPGVDAQVPTPAPSITSTIGHIAPHTNFVGIHEVVVRAGDTLTKVLLHDGLYEMFTPEDVAKLSWQGKQNLLANVVNNLSAEQLREVGISTGKANLLKLGDTIDVMKLARIAKDMTVTVAGEKVPLLKRALELS